MAHRNCNICNTPIVLVPSAEERARKYGGTPQHYINQFTAHADCIIKKRESETVGLVRLLNKTNTLGYRFKVQF